MLSDKKTDDMRDDSFLQQLSVYRLFEDMASKVPDHTAIRFKDEIMSYDELRDRVNHIAAGLRRHQVKRTDTVAIMMKRSIDVIAGILAILKVGAAYLPIDPEYPEERINFMLTDSHTSLLLTHSALADKLEDVHALFVDELLDEHAEEDKGEYSEPMPEDAAYIIYTSGSTGKPKGVMIEHRSVVNFIQGMAEVIDFAEGKRILALTTISFDIFVLEVLVPLTQGMTTVLADEDMQKNPRLLADAIQNYRIDMLQITPSMMHLFMNHNMKKLDCLQHVSEIMIGGEAFPPSLLSMIKKHTSARIYNMYGPTETTVWSTVSDLTEKDSVDIGKPIRHTQIYIMNENLQMVEQGQEGELCIGGAGLARGYVDRPELTEQRFIPNPYVPGERIYRTGDSVRLSADGYIQYLGRIDQQVKIRGHRIELEEVEAALLQHHGISQAAVRSWEDKDNQPYLCAYYLSDADLPSVELREYLSRTLTEYMIPSYFYRLAQIPTTLNGKIDRKSLPAPASISAAKQETPTMPASEDTGVLPVIIDIIRSNVEDAAALTGLADDTPLAELGLHSISFIKILVAIETEFDFEFDDEDIDMKKFSTVQDLVSYVDDRVLITE